MRQWNETYACHGCYGTNIVLAGWLYSSSLADTTEGTNRPQNSTRTTKTRILPIKVIFHFEISWLAALKFKDVLTVNKKKENISVAVEKQQRKSKTERKWKANEETGSSFHLRCTFFSHLRCCDFCLRYVFV